MNSYMASLMHDGLLSGNSHKRKPTQDQYLHVISADTVCVVRLATWDLALICAKWLMCPPSGPSWWASAPREYVHLCAYVCVCVCGRYSQKRGKLVWQKPSGSLRVTLWKGGKGVYTDHWGWIWAGLICCSQMCGLMTASIGITQESLLKHSFIGLTSALESGLPGGSRGSASSASLRRSRWISQQFGDIGVETDLTHIFLVSGAVLGASRYMRHNCRPPESTEGRS